MDAHVLLGMILATPIMSVARAFPEETKILFHFIIRSQLQELTAHWVTE
jgi:hypothetical protein